MSADIHYLRPRRQITPHFARGLNIPPPMPRSEPPAPAIPMITLPAPTHVHETVILGPGVTIARLMHELRHTDIRLSTVGPFQVLTSNPPPDAA